MRTTPFETVIFSAPQGWGKTHHAIQLAQRLGCDGVVDEWKPGDAIVDGQLHLTNVSGSQITLDALNSHTGPVMLRQAFCSAQDYFRRWE